MAVVYQSEYLDNIIDRLHRKYLVALKSKAHKEGYNGDLANKLDEHLAKIKKSKNQMTSVNETESELLPSQEIKTFDEANKYVYHKPWNKLAKIHKMLKLKEYIEEKLPIKTSKNREQLMEQMKEYLDSGKLNKASVVKYDASKAMITLIDILECDSGHYKLK